MLQWCEESVVGRRGCDGQKVEWDVVVLVVAVGGVGVVDVNGVARECGAAARSGGAAPQSHKKKGC